MGATDRPLMVVGSDRATARRASVGQVLSWCTMAAAVRNRSANGRRDVDDLVTVADWV